MTTALSWIVLSIVGAVPFVLSEAIPNPIDAFFEIVSGFTTTGSSILSDPSQMPYSINIWRCFSHWIGGMGVLVFILTLLPLAGGYHMNLMKAESPGPSVGKLLPKVQSTAKILYKIYIALTVALIILLLLGGCLFTTVSVQHLELPEPVVRNQIRQYGKLQLIYSDRHHYLYDPVWRKLQCLFSSSHQEVFSGIEI